MVPINGIELHFSVVFGYIGNKTRLRESALLLLLLLLSSGRAKPKMVLMSINIRAALSLKYQSLVQIFAGLESSGGGGVYKYNLE
jgi:hypothetical protein